MQLPLASRYQFFRSSLLLLFLITTSLAITVQQFVNTFNLDDPVNGPGGCHRNAPNGVPMLSYALDATTDAFNMATTVNTTINNYKGSTGKRLRALLFLFFGISFELTSSDFRPSPNSRDSFIIVRGARLP